MIRAARATLAVGYEPEARAQDRIVIELQAHRKAILEDETGAEAKAWIDGDRVYGITKRVAEIAPGDLYANLSQDSHGDPRPVERLHDPETGSLELGPKRTLATKASLLMHAGWARDQMVLIAAHAGIEISGLDRLDAAIKAAEASLQDVE